MTQHAPQCMLPTDCDDDDLQNLKVLPGMFLILGTLQKER